MSDQNTEMIAHIRSWHLAGANRREVQEQVVKRISGLSSGVFAKTCLAYAVNMYGDDHALQDAIIAGIKHSKKLLDEEQLSFLEKTVHGLCPRPKKKEETLFI